MTEAARKNLEEIARRFLDLDTLDTRSSDDLDFSDQAVWNLEAALAAAYAAGRSAGMAEGAIAALNGLKVTGQR